MASGQDSEHEHEMTVPISTEPSDLFAVDDRLIRLERESKTLTRHVGQIEGALFNQMMTISVLEVVFALLLASLVWVEYRRRTGSEVSHGTVVRK